MFSDALSNAPAALERVDVLFVGLCVEDVMARHAPPSLPVSPEAPAPAPAPAALSLTDHSTALC
ncbi:hypothetical protein LGM89_05920 [Burkholderia sp. AU31624]|uniref:hypothetical protein n=1 Tax=Burkholderia sp. AU31624 TaxID=2879629 RepID=UPI001CF29F00|nr:hypothetical protein [Burkholderia sp. AU31624]MCA8252791.1 hypothetical protein [Burkholderia sp. AU31624]